jgi:type I restriction enzyme, S subunit
MSSPPAEWAIARLGEIAETQLGRMLSAKRETGAHARRYLRNRDVQWGQINVVDLPLMDFGPADMERYRLAVGDLLVCEGGEVGRAAIWRGLVDDCYYQKALHRVRPSHGISSAFLRYLLEYYADTHAFSRFTSGSTIAHLPQEDLRKLAVPVPPSAEQERIVASIEEQFSRLDAGVAALERARQNLKRMRSAVLVNAFAQLEDGVDATNGQELFSFVTSGSRGWAKYYNSDGPAFIRIGNVPRDGIDLDLSDAQRVAPPGNAEGTRTRVQPGDLMISITADLGRVAVAPVSLGEAYINQHLALARPVDGAVPRYLAWYLASPHGLRQWDALRRGATKIGLGLDDIRAVKIPMPLVSVQQATVDSIEAAWTVLDVMERSLIAVDKKGQRLRSCLLAAAFSGKLVSQDPSEEPASSLLKRIATERTSASSKRGTSARRPRKSRTGVAA